MSNDLTEVRTGDLSPRRSLFEEWLRSHSGHTAAAYRHDWRLFAAWLGDRPPEGRPWPPETAVEFMRRQTRGNARRWLGDFQNHLRERGEAPATINRRLSSICSFTTWASDNDLLGYELRPQHYERAEPNIRPAVSPKSANAMLRAAAGTRDRLLLRLLWDCGLRRSECAALRLEDVDHVRKSLMVKSKRRRTRERTLLPEPTIAALCAWLQKRPKSEDDRLLLLSPRGVGKAIERLAASAGVGKVSPHQFRHAHLTQGRNAGGDMDEAAASMRSTVSNLERYDDERLERALRFREPVAKLLG